MAHDVFICHANEDRERAQEIGDSLEARGMQCWIAPRDVPAGVDYAEAIIDAIAASGVMVLVFSSHANASHHVRREMECAANSDVPIVPFKIEDVPATGGMRYYIESIHCLDAFTPPLDQHLERLGDAVDGLLRKGVTPAAPPTQPEEPAPVPPTETPPPEPERPVPPHMPPAKPALSPMTRRMLFIGGAVLALAVVALITYLLTRESRPPGGPEPTISESEVSILIARWQDAQSSGDFSAYAACYGREFKGIKRTLSGRAYPYNRDEWLADRETMIRPGSSLTVKVEDLSVSLGPGRNEASAEFEQIYRSHSYSDQGQKLMRFRKTGSTVHIVYEEMKSSSNLSENTGASS